MPGEINKKLGSYMFRQLSYKWPQREHMVNILPCLGLGVPSWHDWPNLSFRTQAFVSYLIDKRYVIDLNQGKLNGRWLKLVLQNTTMRGRIQDGAQLFPGVEWLKLYGAKTIMYTVIDM